MNLCAFNKGTNCSVLGDKNCNGCSFFKTVLELEEGRVKAKQRIDSLSAEAKQSIMDKYYHKAVKGARGC